ncbi:nucleoid-associated protein [Criibacterium bergeronii]|uniref:Nucleoid-associated protein n=1 Tax=Criibacterium bergeronii TaxID=1871336 RepID=A0A371IN96_9FIRM|nr:nucleoid-associated protein [Criibacterium bergeronii]RDY21951.1 nucleoid-associated protein [Criibacterium bergeronii]
MFELAEIEYLQSYMIRLSSYENEPVISNFDIDSDDDITLSFIEKTITNLMLSDEMKSGSFITDDERCSKAYKLLLELSTDLPKLKTCANEIAQEYYTLVVNNDKVASGDLIITLFQMERSNYLGFFKYNHKNMYVTNLIKNKGANNINIVELTSLITSERHKADEGFILNLNNFEMAIIDKKYEINSENQWIYKDVLLLLETEHSQKEKFDIFNKVTKNIEKKYLLGDVEKTASLKKAVKDVVDDGTILIEEVVNQAFDKTSEMNELYKDALGRSGIEMTDKIEVKETVLKSKFERQKIKTETGIEINIPIDYYSDASKVEFLPDEDGTVSILIKNIKNLSI